MGSELVGALLSVCQRRLLIKKNEFFLNTRREKWVFGEDPFSKESLEWASNIRREGSSPLLSVDHQQTGWLYTSITTRSYHCDDSPRERAFSQFCERSSSSTSFHRYFDYHTLTRWWCWSSGIAWSRASLPELDDGREMPRNLTYTDVWCVLSRCSRRSTYTYKASG